MTATDRCPTCGFDPPTVSPSDAAVAARSYPRRYRALLVRPDEDDPDIVHRRPAPGEPSAVEHAALAAAGMGAAAAALRRVATAEDPDVELSTGDAAPGPATLDDVLARLATAAGDLAAAVEGVRGDDWRRTGRLGDGTTVTALDLARQGVHQGSHHLRAVERVLAEVR